LALNILYYPFKLHFFWFCPWFFYNYLFCFNLFLKFSMFFSFQIPHQRFKFSDQPLQFHFPSHLVLYLLITFFFLIIYQITNIFQSHPYYFLIFQIWSLFFWLLFVLIDVIFKLSFWNFIILRVFLYQVLSQFFLLLPFICFDKFFLIDIFLQFHSSKLNRVGIKLLYWTQVLYFTGCEF
jgi:hypothetical protein